MRARGSFSGAVRLLALGAAMLVGAGTAWAGPATYDKETKSFRLAYTFADLAGAGITDRVPIVGANHRPTTEEEDTIKALTAQVSIVLGQVTDGRARISRLDYVDDIKAADIVVSLTGKPSSAGWATRGAIDNQPGYIVLYYQTLVPFIKQDVVYTATHEFCHYAFNLVDEYQPNLPVGCPSRPGAGCLMDNYFSSMRGYMGRFCNDTEHVASPAQPQSCQRVVDQFFDGKGVAKDPNAGAGSGVLANNAVDTDPRPGLIQTAIGKVRARSQEDLAARKPGTSSASGTAGNGKLKAFAKGVFQELISDFNRNHPNKAIFTPAHVAKAIELIVKVGSFVATGKPPGLEQVVFNLIRAEAKKVGDSVATDKSETTRASKIRGHLATFIGELAKQNIFSAPDFPKEMQRELIQQLAREEARSLQDKALDRLVGINEVGIQLDREIASNIVDILDELGAPGIAARRAELRAFDERLKTFSIPGRTSATFGRRRTRFINPDPVDGAKYGYVLTQGGVYPYTAIRDRGFQQFARLIDRERIELVEPRFSAESLVGGGEPLDVRIDRPFEGAASSNLARISSQRNTNFQALLNDLYDQLQRDRLENIAVLVPPGGLPAGVAQSLDVLRAKLPQGNDVRLDIVMVGPTVIPTALRDLALRSRGSVLTITDIDEIGAIAQRLKNEQTSGSWLIIPQQGTIPQRRAFPAPDRLADLIRAAKSFQILAVDGQGGFKEPSLEVMNALKDAKASLATLSKATVTQATKDRIDEAWTRLGQIQILLGKTGDDLMAYDGPANAARPGAGLPGAADFRAANLVLIRDVAQLKTEIERIKALVKLSDFTPNSDAEPNAIAAETKPADPAAKMPDGGDAIAANPAAPADKDEAPKDPTTALRKLIVGKQSDAQLGLNMVNLDDLVRQLEGIAGAELEKTGDNVPIFQRIDRNWSDDLRRQAEVEANESKTDPILKHTNDAADSPRIRLARFYAEKDAVNPDAELELIVGLTRPLPGVDLLDAPPVLELLDDTGATVSSTGGKGLGEALAFDGNTSTETLLVYRVQAPRSLLEQGYTPFLLLKPDTVKALKANDLNFSFSVGSTRRNVQLLAGLVDDLTDNTRGTLRSTDRAAVVEVNVSAGSAVRDARVVGFCERIVPGSAPIVTQKVEFQDKGQVVRPALGAQAEVRDKVAGDGIYTASIPIAGVDRGTEFRVFIQADTTDGKARYVSMDDPNPDDPKKNNPSIGNDKARAVEAKASQDLAQGAALKFQRATSIHFRVEP